MFSLVVLVHLLHIGIIRKNVINNCKLLSIRFASIFDEFYLFVGHRSLKLQNKMELLFMQ